MEKRTTADGSTTLYSDTFGELYHSESGARKEAREKFALPLLSALEGALPDPFSLLDIGFGPGYNTIETLRALFQTAPHTRVSITALEADPAPVQEAATLHSDEADPILKELIAHCSPTQPGGTQTTLTNGIDFRLLIGDARRLARALPAAPGFHAILLDGFSTRKNPELWSADFFRVLYRLLSSEGMLLTYSAAYPVLSGLEEAGFTIGMTPAVGRHSGGTAAWKGARQPFPPHPAERECERRDTTGRLPFRDPELSRSRGDILSAYEQERQLLLGAGVPSIRRFRKGLPGR